MAKTLKQDDIVKLLTESLHEEQTAAKNILSDATAVLKEAAAQEDEDEDEDADEEEDEQKDSEEKESDEKSKEDEAEAAPELEGVASKSAKKTKK